MDSGPAQLTLAVGTYTIAMPHVDGNGQGIVLLRFDTATGRLAQVVARQALNPSYLTISADGRRLYAVREVDARNGPGVVTYALDARAGTLDLLDNKATSGGCPCFVSFDESTGLLLVANYETGEVLSYRVDAHGVPCGDPVVLQRTGGGPRGHRQEGPHAHCAFVSPDRRHVYLADLGIDCIVRHPIRDGQVDASSDEILPAAPGAGPRHLAFTPSAAFLLANYELSSTVRLYRIGAYATELAAEVSTLPTHWDGVSGAGGMRLHPSGRYVYVGNRGHDSIFGARIDECNGSLTPIGTWALGGRTPRDLTVSPDGRFLLAASQDDGFIRVFSIDEQSGALAFTGHDFPIQSAASLQFV